MGKNKNISNTQSRGENAFILTYGATIMRKTAEINHHHCVLLRHLTFTYLTTHAVSDAVRVRGMHAEHNLWSMVRCPRTFKNVVYCYK